MSRRIFLRSGGAVSCKRSRAVLKDGNVAAVLHPSLTTSLFLNHQSQSSSLHTSCSDQRNYSQRRRRNISFNTLLYSSAVSSTDDVDSSQRNRNSEYINHATSSDDVDQKITTSTTSSCYLDEPLMTPGTPLPPPLPNPNYSFRGRVLPSNLIAFNSTEGKQRFMHSLQTDYAESYFPLSQQFLNQYDPAYCGVTTLVLVLNALSIDPNVRWRGGWRWYGDEQMLLERCCLEKERVAREGITLEQFCGLARCQGVRTTMKRPLNHDRGNGYDDASCFSSNTYDINEFRNDIIHAVRMPPRTHWETGQANEVRGNAGNEGCFLVTSFARKSLSQTGDGHFSPIAAYHEPTDSCLVLDVARFKYTPYWVTVTDLFDAMIPKDKATSKSRGWLLMYPPPTKRKSHDSKKPLTVEEMEGKRPADCVPLAASGIPICAVEQIKVEYCSAKNTK